MFDVAAALPPRTPPIAWCVALSVIKATEAPTEMTPQVCQNTLGQSAVDRTGLVRSVRWKSRVRRLPKGRLAVGVFEQPWEGSEEVVGGFVVGCAGIRIYLANETVCPN